MADILDMKADAAWRATEQRCAKSWREKTCVTCGTSVDVRPDRFVYDHFRCYSCPEHHSSRG